MPCGFTPIIQERREIMSNKIRTQIAKTLMPCGVHGEAIDIIVKEVEKDVAWPGFGITRTDVANMTVKYRPDRKDVVIYAGRRDWQFGEDGSLIGAGYGCGCGCC
jgi:hypothetical protein